MTGMFEVLMGGVIYTGVVEENGRWIDSAGRDLTKGKLLGTYLGYRYHFDGGRYAYYRNGDSIYQLTPEGDYLWLCDVAVEDAFKRIWGMIE